jgi:hypothetical protein
VTTFWLSSRSPRGWREQDASSRSRHEIPDRRMLYDRPRRLLLISTRNLSNAELEGLFRPLIPSILREFSACTFLELSRAGLIVRG